MLLIHDVPVSCINQAAINYHVPAKVIISVLDTEGGSPGLAKRNTNGTYDLGVMQINTIWLKKVAAYGYDRAAIQDNPCINVAVGTWILSQNIADGKSWWTGIGDYHSHTPSYNVQYQRLVYRHYASLTRELAYA